MSNEPEEKEGPEAPGGGGEPAGAPGETSGVPPSEPKGEEPTEEAPKDEGGDDRDAQIAELRRQLDEAAPILQAHKDAEEAQKSEIQKANERADSLESELTKLRDEAARARVAEKTGLPSEIVGLLAGSSEEDLLQAAEKVASTRGDSGLKSRSKPLVGPGASKGGAEDADATDPAALAAAIRKRMPY